LINERALEALLEVYPLDKWTVETVFNYYFVNNEKLCRICDKWEHRRLLRKHVDQHISEWRKVDIRRKEEAKAKRLEALRLYHETKKREKEQADGT
jgi:hypothetical protein